MKLSIKYVCVYVCVCVCVCVTSVLVICLMTACQHRKKVHKMFDRANSVVGLMQNEAPFCMKTKYVIQQSPSKFTFCLEKFWNFVMKGLHEPSNKFSL